MVIVQGPTLANPEAFDTVVELRRELHRANASLLEYSAQVERRDAVGIELAGLVNAVLMQHLRGDHRGVAAILDAQLEASPRLRERLEEMNECSEIRQINQWVKASSDDKHAEPLPTYNCEGDDPWSKSTVAELRRALDVANRAGVSTVRELKGFKDMLDGITREVAQIVIAHVKGDRDALSQALSAFCEKHVVVSGDPQQQVH